MTLETQTESALSDYVKKFLLEFKDEKGNFRYVDDIDTMMPSKLKFINVDYNDLVLHPDIESVFHENPDSILEAFSRAIKEILQERFPKYAKKIEHEVRARIANYPVQRSLRQINAEVIGKITSVSGMVLRASEVKPLAKELVFVCPEGHRTDVLLGHGLTLTSPVQCSNPKCNHRELGVEPESSRFIDVQFVRLQELPEDLPPGQLPHYLDVTVKQDLVDNARPGDRVVLTGVVRIEQEKMSGVSKNSSPLYRLRLDGNNVEFLGGGKKDKKSRKIQREEISTEDEKMIKSLSKSPDLYQQLIDSYAPHITGHEVVKESILLLMAGSTQRELQDGSKIRGDINIFLVGDPGTAKSEMLKFCVRVAPRGLYTSGRGSTAAGLTAAVVRDTNGIFMLEAGATVLGDQGLVCIDEFDKMKTEDRSALHEVMEQQTASISKGGIVATLNARTSILAAANPMYGKYDPFKNITENVNLPIPLLTRFDLIHVIRDKPSKEKDTKIAQHIINLHTPKGIDQKSLIDSETLTKYLSYVKRIDPKLTKEAEEKILDYYMKMRTVEAEEMITVTPRQLEGLIRMATARARLLLKTQVEEEDAERAIYLLQNMFESAGIDVNTGKVDLGVLQGRPRSEVSKIQLFMDIMKSLEGEHKTPVDEKQLIEELAKTEKFTEEEAKNFTRKMARDSSIYESKPGHYNRV
ncbi:MAG: minichromosome maintenance protein MCM [Thaumarchaeota archaeon]|nr:minichromosome maintenance protein MCM [Nitrososphaerota archaeon]MBT4056866.1 minichromosome maintenance protein MCM [Nitrososphaerota archaeon]MBT6171532.1 minichromosome maintenance protein MCM [Nitrososphaerota archaeon]MBT6370789.1 minichromosome maintenance protein MCM [Nitrososphaerota archaeon]MBT7359069.1 minichromosome maintenance protein MCM [Nitrososphaerota archaeon]